jgi:hypothetical protein
MDGVRPSSVAAPSIWYAAVAAPQMKPAGKRSRPSVDASVFNEDVTLSPLPA